jgi:chemotaxis protein MotB
MIEGKNPFSEKAAQDASAPPAFSRLPWIAAAGAVIAAIIFLVGWYNALEQAHALSALPAKLRATSDALSGALADNAKLAEQITALQNQVTALEQQKNEATQTAHGLEDEMRAALESKDVTISKLQGKLTVNILDRVLFDSGEADLKPAGEVVMRKIAALLADHPSLKIHVIGHTDNVPIAPAARSRFASNWELSSERALAAVHFLTERAGVDARRVGAVGYGEFRPVAENLTPEGRAKNRRIAIVILPDEIMEAEKPAPPPAGLN